MEMTLQFMDRLLTMFNVLLILAGVLEYVLLGIDFHVSYILCIPRIHSNNFLFPEQHTKHLPWRHLDSGRIYQCRHRLLSNTEVRGHPRFISCHDATLVPRSPQWQNFVYSRC